MTLVSASRWKRFGVLVGPALVLAGLLNGLGTHLRRIGLWDPAGYEAYWQLHCPGGETTSDPLGVGRRCKAPDLSNPPRIPHRAGTEYFFRSGLGDRWLKGAKGAFVLFLLAVGLGSVRSLRWSTVGAIPPQAIALALLVCIGAVRTLAGGDGLALAAGGLSFLFLVIGLTCDGFIAEGGLRVVAPWVAVLLWAQLLFVPGELLFGIPINGYLPFLHLPRRMSGTFTLPNSLGVFAIVAFAFVSTFLPERRRWPLLIASVMLVWVSGSGTGVVVLLWWAAAAIYRTTPEEKRARVVLVSALVACVVMGILAPLLGRQTVYKGVFGEMGRVASLKRLLVEMDTSSVIFGEGLGRGTNTLVRLSGVRAVGAGDSTATSLVRQTGLLGCAAFYLLLGSAWRRDPCARPFYEVLSLASLTLAVTELFPVNVLLGLALGRSLWHTPEHWPKNESA